jgi:mannitol-1-phosphate 5-dehydrogenase
MSGTALHFGAGALGRGLVLTRLFKAGAELAVADTDIALIDHIRANKGYRLTIASPQESRDIFVPVARAYAIGRDDAALDAEIEGSVYVTTSVQIGNLHHVINRIQPVWSRSDGRRRHLIGCENKRHVGGFIEDLFDKAGGLPQGVVCPDCVVDRICAAAATDFVVETEPYSEWVAELATDAGLPGPDGTDDVDRLFFRKRYLVNGLADAASFLGLAKKRQFLHEAMADREIADELAPLLELYRQHLERVFGFSAQELMAYQRTCVARLSNPGISRRLDTVARDPWRKFGHEERFLEPIIAEAQAGRDVSAACATFMRLTQAVQPDDRQRFDKLTAIWRGTPAETMLAPALAGNSRGG